MPKKKMLLSDFMEGMGVVFKHMFKKIETMQYPEKERWKPYKRFRGAIGLDTQKCAVCCMCTNVCPSKAITIVGKENEKGEKEIDKFEVNISRCIFCGLCVDYCPRDAIVNTSAYELAVYDRKELIFDQNKLEEILNKYRPGEEGGIVEKVEGK